MRTRALPLLLPLLLLPPLLLGAPARAQVDSRPTFAAEFDRGVRLIQQGKPAEGIAAFERCLEIEPKNPEAAYNIACGHSLLGEKAKALEWLAKAAERGFADGELTGTDKDLDAIRGEPGFAPLLDRIRGNADRAQKEARVPVVHEPPGYDRAKPSPLLVLLHGAGGTKGEFAKPFEEVADEAGFLLLAVQGTLPRGENGYAWFDPGYLRTPGKFENPILDVVRQAKRERAIDPDRVYLLGFSQGAEMAVYTGLRSPGLFRGAIGIGGGYAVREAAGAANLRAAADRGFRAFLLIGEKEVAEVKGAHHRGVEQLKGAGIRVEAKTFAGGHELPAAASRKGTLLEALRWLDANAPAPATKPAPAAGERKDG
ncbi:MAG: hypothetical protein L0323_22300 [Planctomycetes bacterium]|nr:hypothetical protein [Planctomycetota bacterium]